MDKTAPLAALVAALALSSPPAAAAAKPRMVVTKRALHAMSAVAAPERQPIEYKWPTLPEGVLPVNNPENVQVAMDAALPGEIQRHGLAMDDGGSCAPAFGFLNSSVTGGGLWFPGYPYLAELTQISEYRAPCETISTEMTRKWIDLQSKDGGDKSDKISEIMARFEELQIRDLCRRAALIDAEFGRAQIYLNIDDANDLERQKPLLIEDGGGIKKGSLKSLSVIEPYWSTPYSWNASYPERTDFYKPTSWYIMGRKTHATRLLTFIGREVPDLLKPAYNFGGISLIQLGEQTTNYWLRTRKAVNDLINNFSMLVLHTDLGATLEDGEDGTGLLARMQLLTLMRNNQGVNAINKDSELLEFAEASLAGLSDLQAQSQEHMAAVYHTPLIKLFGLTPKGLGATGEGEIQVWYDWVGAFQQNLMGPNVNILLKAVQLDLYGEIDDDIIVHWVTLDEPTQKELSEIRKSDADAGAGYINAGVISPEEERERLQNDPDSGYSNLTGPPPEPPEPEMPTTDPEGDAGREHDASEADKDREHEMALAKQPPAVPIKAKTGA